MDIEFAAGSVHTMNRNNIPSVNETIADDIDLDVIAKHFCTINIYFREKESCPYNRGNWLIDFFETREKIIPLFCLKLPAEMKEKDVMRWVKPLMDKLKEKLN